MSWFSRSLLNSVVKNSYTEFHENPTNRLVDDTPRHRRTDMFSTSSFINKFPTTAISLQDINWKNSVLFTKYSGFRESNIKPSRRTRASIQSLTHLQYRVIGHLHTPTALLADEEPTFIPNGWQSNSPYTDTLHAKLYPNPFSTFRYETPYHVSLQAYLHTATWHQQMIAEP